MRLPPQALGRVAAHGRPGRARFVKCALSQPGDKHRSARTQRRRVISHIIHCQVSVPENQIVCLRVRGQWTSARRRYVFQKLDARPVVGAQPRDVQSRTENLVQMFLLDAIVLTFAGDVKAEYATIERETPVGIQHHDGRVIDAKKNICAGLLPFRVTPSLREENNFEHVIFRITEVKRLDAGGTLVPRRKRLRTG